MREGVLVVETVGAVESGGSYEKSHSKKVSMELRHNTC